VYISAQTCRLAKELEKDNPLVGEMAHSSSMTLHDIGVHSKYVNSTFADLAASLWERHGAILMGEMCKTGSNTTHSATAPAPTRSRVSRQSMDGAVPAYDPLVSENESKVGEMTGMFVFIVFVHWRFIV
jgi:hypothetical protein